MKSILTLAGGAVASLLGVIGVSIWADSFFSLIAAILPVMLVVGGGLAIYLGIDEIKAQKVGDDF